MKKLLLVLLFTIALKICFAQNWTRQDHEYGISSNGYGILKEVKDYLIVGSYYGIYKSNDNGRSWFYSSTGLNSPERNSITSVASTSEGIFVSTGSREIFKSKDDGNTWNKLPDPGPVAYLFSLRDSIYLYKDRDSLYVSDKGTKWTALSKPKGSPEVFGSYIYSYQSCVLCEQVDGIIYRSFNGKDFTYYIRVPELTKYRPSLKGADHDLFFESNGSLYHSSNGGEWVQRLKLGTGRIPHIEYIGQRLFAILIENQTLQLKYSDDKGISWHTDFPFSGLPQIRGDDYITAIPFKGKYGYFIPKNKSLFYLANGDTVWQRMDKGLRIIDLAYGMNNIGSTLFHGNFRSDDNGKTWKELSQPLNESKEKFYIYKINNVLFSQYRKSNTNVYLYISKDLGTSWQKRSELPDFIRFHSDGTKEKLFVNTQGSFSKPKTLFSSDNGLSWDSIQNLGEPSDIISDDKISIGLSGEFLVRSFDNGLNWENLGRKTGILLKGDDNDFYILSPRNPGSITNFEFRLYKSSDNGSTWSVINTKGLPAPGQYLDYTDFKFDNGSLYLAHTSGGLYKSIDKGETWNSINGNLPPEILPAKLLFTQDHIFIGTQGHGLWSMEKIDVPLSVDQKSVLEKNQIIYPNPNNGTFKVLGVHLKNGTYSILNNTGQIVEKIDIKIAGQEIKLNDHKPGLYMLLNSEGYFEKFVVE